MDYRGAIYTDVELNMDVKDLTVKLGPMVAEQEKHRCRTGDLISELDTTASSASTTSESP